MTDDLRADLDQLFLERRRRPVPDRLRRRQRTQKIAKVVGERMKLKTHGVGVEGPARKPCPFDRPLAFLDELLACAALVVEGDDVLGAPRHIRHDKADTRIEFARVPLHLGDDTARSRPASGPIGEVRVRTPHIIRRSPHGARQQMADPFLQDSVGRQANGVFDPIAFENVVNFGISEAGVASKVDAGDLAFVALHNRLQHALPPVGAMDVAGMQRAALQIAKLVEHKQRMIAGAFVVPVPDAVLLFAMGGTDA